MTITIRSFQLGDFDILLDLANQAAPFALDENKEWLEYRKAFDESQRMRHHYIAEENDRPVGYGCLEQQSDDPRWLRVFVVCHPLKLPEVGSKLYDQLLKKAKEVSATHIWAREYQEDQPISEFFKERGFVETKRFRLPDQRPMVVFRLDLV